MPGSYSLPQTAPWIAYYVAAGPSTQLLWVRRLGDRLRRSALPCYLNHMATASRENERERGVLAVMFTLTKTKTRMAVDDLSFLFCAVHVALAKSCIIHYFRFVGFPSNVDVFCRSVGENFITLSLSV